MNADPRNASDSPWHAGEKRIQQLLGVADRMESFGRKVIRPFMPEQHQLFYRQLPFIVVGGVDDSGDTWATLLEGEPGFIHADDERHLHIGRLPAPSDPLATCIRNGESVGLLGIELHTRRRNRMNGQISDLRSGGIQVFVEHAFGNCPQYIQRRDFRFSRPPETKPSGDVTAGRIEELAAGLDEDAIRLISQSDTFFVSSYIDHSAGEVPRSVDVSHRGGKPGFVQVSGDSLTIPDFAGNLHFNTLGNFLVNPRAGLLFVDFSSGDVLQMTGRAEVNLSPDPVRGFQGAERSWTFRPTKIVRRRDALAIRFDFHEWSPNSLMTGSWEEAHQKQIAERKRSDWRPFVVTRIVDESSSVKSFFFAPNDDAGIGVFEAGQHIPIRIPSGHDGETILRTYTVSSAPSDPELRISVKRQGAGSTALHDGLSVGSIVDLKAPRGNFTIRSEERRPAVLISAGIGVTPMLAMLRHLVFEGERTRFMRPTWFIRGDRTLATRPFDAELSSLMSRSNGRAARVEVLSEPEEGTVQGEHYSIKGVIDLPLLQSLLPFGDHDFFLCGPPAFMQSVYDALRSVRVQDDRIHAESFGPASISRTSDSTTPSTKITARASKSSALVLFSESAKEARWTVTSGSLLDLAESRGLTPDYSCRGGSCGTCATRLISGGVAYASPPSAEISDGMALICCAVPAEGENRIVLGL